MIANGELSRNRQEAMLEKSYSPRKVYLPEASSEVTPDFYKGCCESFRLIHYGSKRCNKPRRASIIVQNRSQAETLFDFRCQMRKNGTRIRLQAISFLYLTGRYFWYPKFSLVKTQRQPL